MIDMFESFYFLLGVMNNLLLIAIFLSVLFSRQSNYRTVHCAACFKYPLPQQEVTFCL